MMTNKFYKLHCDKTAWINEYKKNAQNQVKPCFGVSQDLLAGECSGNQQVSGK